MNIYKITNTLNGKLYIGQTKLTVEKRLEVHRKNAQKRTNRHLYDAMNHYGVENFHIEHLEITTVKDADEREIFWIAKLGTRSPIGYNMTKGGGGGDTLASWPAEKKTALYKQQGDNRRSPRRQDWKDAIARASKLREAGKTEDQKAAIAEKISKTNKRKGITFPKTVMYGKENPNFIEVNIEESVSLIAAGWKLKQLAERIGTTTSTVGSKLKASTGKTFTELRKEHGIVGPFGKPRRVDPA